MKHEAKLSKQPVLDSLLKQEGHLILLEIHSPMAPVEPTPQYDQQSCWFHSWTLVSFDVVSDVKSSSAD